MNYFKRRNFFRTSLGLSLKQNIIVFRKSVCKGITFFDTLQMFLKVFKNIFYSIQKLFLYTPYYI